MTPQPPSQKANYYTITVAPYLARRHQHRHDNLNCASKNAQFVGGTRFENASKEGTKRRSEVRACRRSSHRDTGEVKKEGQQRQNTLFFPLKFHLNTPAAQHAFSLSQGLRGLESAAAFNFMFFCFFFKFVFVGRTWITLGYFFRTRRAFCPFWNRIVSHRSLVLSSFRSCRVA